MGLAGMVKPPVPSLLPTKGSFSAPRPTKSPLLTHTCCTNSNCRRQARPHENKHDPSFGTIVVENIVGKHGPYDAPRRSTRWILVLTIVSFRPSLGLTPTDVRPERTDQSFRIRLEILKVVIARAIDGKLGVVPLRRKHQRRSATPAAPPSSPRSTPHPLSTAALARRKRRNAATSQWSCRNARKLPLRVRISGRGQRWNRAGFVGAPQNKLAWHDGILTGFQSPRCQ